MPLEENTGWFVFTEGQQHGPVAAENLIAFLAAHTGPPVHVWRDGFADWTLASDVPELAVSPQLPPLAPLLEPPPAAAEAPAEPVAPPAKRVRGKLIGSAIGATVGLLVSLPKLLIGGEERFN